RPPPLGLPKERGEDLPRPREDLPHLGDPHDRDLRAVGDRLLARGPHLVPTEPEDGEAGVQPAELRDQAGAVEVARRLAGDHQEGQERIGGSRHAYGMGAGGPDGNGYMSQATASPPTTMPKKSWRKSFTCSLRSRRQRAVKKRLTKRA